MRTKLALVLALALALLAPTAIAAEPIASAGIGPGPSVVDGHDGTPYYVLLHLRAPEAPREGEAEDDCSYDPERPGKQPPPLATALLGLALDVARWDPAEEPRISGWYPRCFATTYAVNGSPVWGRVAYDVTTGEYYVEANTDLIALGEIITITGPITIPIPILPMSSSAQTELRIVGGLGIGSEADCETCPPPL